MKKKFNKIIITVISLCLFFIVLRFFVFPKIHLVFYKQSTVVDYFYSNKEEFEYIVNNIQKRDVTHIEKIDNKIIFSVDKRLEHKGIVKNESLYRNDEELKKACNKLFEGVIPLKIIWVDEFTNSNKRDFVGIKFDINSILFSSKYQGICYVKNGKPSSEVKSKYVQIDKNWYYFEEDWDDLMGG